MGDLSVETPSGSLAVRDFGGEGPAVLLLHGAGHNLEVWRDVVSAIRGRCHVVAVDLRGHGQSAVGDTFTMADLVSDTHQVCAALNLNSPVLVGHSLGGWVALATAALGGIARLVSIEGPVLAFEDLYRGVGMVPDGGRASEDFVASVAFHGDEHAWARHVTAAGPPQSIARAVAERGRLRHADGEIHRRPLSGELIAARRCAWEVDPAVLYPRLGIPVTIALATTPPNVMHADRFVEIRDAAANTLARTVADLRVVRVPGGHHLPVESARDVAEIIVAAVS